MRTFQTSFAFLAAACVGLGLLGAPRGAAADTGVMGTYDVQFEEASNTCTNVGMALGRGGLTVKKGAGSTVTVDIERIPLMSGTPSKGGKVKATSKIAATSIQGLDGRFSVAGKVADNMINLVFVAEYYAKGAAMCTQSWNVAGVRKAPAGAK